MCDDSGDTEWDPHDGLAASIACNALCHVRAGDCPGMMGRRE